MALVKCPECHREISSLAKTCPFCGAPIASILAAAAKSVRLHFHRGSAFLGSAIWGFVLVDGIAIGEARSGTSFSVMVEPGQHTIAVDTRCTGQPDYKVIKTYSTTINIPSSTQSISIEVITTKPSFATVLEGAGGEMCFGSITRR